MITQEQQTFLDALPGRYLSGSPKNISAEKLRVDFLDAMGKNLWRGWQTVLLPATIAALEEETHFDEWGRYRTGETGVPAIAAVDLWAEKTHHHTTQPRVYFRCFPDGWHRIDKNFVELFGILRWVTDHYEVLGVGDSHLAKFLTNAQLSHDNNKITIDFSSLGDVYIVNAFANTDESWGFAHAGAKVGLTNAEIDFTVPGMFTHMGAFRYTASGGLYQQIAGTGTFSIQSQSQDQLILSHNDCGLNLPRFLPTRPDHDLYLGSPGGSLDNDTTTVSLINRDGTPRVPVDLERFYVERTSIIQGSNTKIAPADMPIAGGILGNVWLQIILYYNGG